MDDYFPDDILKGIFLNENIWISNSIWLKFAPKGPIGHNTALVQIMAWRWTGDKPLSEPMMAKEFVIDGTLLHSPEGNFIGNTEDIYPWYDLGNYQFRITAISPWGQWLKSIV